MRENNANVLGNSERRRSLLRVELRAKGSTTGVAMDRPLVLNLMIIVGVKKDPLAVKDRERQN